MAAQTLGVDYDQLQQLADMGFPFDMCIEALMSTNNLLQATDYLLNPTPTGSSGESRRATPRTRPVEPQAAGATVFLIYFNLW